MTLHSPNIQTELRRANCTGKQSLALSKHYDQLLNDVAHWIGSCSVGGAQKIIQRVYYGGQPGQNTGKMRKRRPYCRTDRRLDDRHLLVSRINGLILKEME